MIDLDNFKSINDTYGHSIGDKVLQLVSRRFENITRNIDLIARLGGDEFAIILNNITKNFDPFTVAEKIIDSISQPMDINGQHINIGATIGISVSPEDALNLEDFIHHADKALYKAKHLGKGRYFLYQHLADDEK
jgi:diguanylate cyclase (GGDEF)-like protein